MNNEQLLQRISIDPKVMVGKPVIRGTRLTVEYVLNLLADRATVEEIRSEYPVLDNEDIRAYLVYATRGTGRTGA